jgi:hypothetical protein
MSIMLAGVVPELGFMHLVTSSKSYETVSRVVTQPLRRINEMSVMVGEIQHLMTFMIIAVERDQHVTNCQGENKI